MNRLKLAGEWTPYEDRYHYGDACIVIAACVTPPGTMCSCGCNRMIEQYAIDLRASVKMQPNSVAPDGFHEIYSEIFFAETEAEAREKTEITSQILYDKICTAIIKEFTTQILSEDEAIAKISSHNSKGIDPCKN